MSLVNKYVYGDAKKRISHQQAKCGGEFFCAQRHFPCHSVVYDGIGREKGGRTEKESGLFGDSQRKTYFCGKEG